MLQYIILLSFQLIYSETTNHIPVVIQITALDEGIVVCVCIHLISRGAGCSKAG